MKKNNVTKIGEGHILSKGQQHESYLPPYLLLNKNALTEGTMANKYKEGWKKDAHNERAQRQDEIERRLVG